jgi:hypothetical protein
MLNEYDVPFLRPDIITVRAELFAVVTVIAPGVDTIV